MEIITPLSHLYKKSDFVETIVSFQSAALEISSQASHLCRDSKATFAVFQSYLAATRRVKARSKAIVVLSLLVYFAFSVQVSR